MKTGHESQMKSSAIGSRKSTVPNTSTQAWALGDRRPMITSMRTCSLRSNV